MSAPETFPGGAAAPDRGGAASGLSDATVGFGIALGVASTANALLVIAKERNPGVMAWMAKATGHHWATHSLLALLLFLLLGVALTRARALIRRLTVGALLGILVGGVSLGSAMIAGFYLFAG